LLINTPLSLHFLKTPLSSRRNHAQKFVGAGIKFVKWLAVDRVLIISNDELNVMGENREKRKHEEKEGEHKTSPTTANHP